uniref:site-specific DNA-methyltransferase (adenine-specific) n=1 Tax=Mycolicibacterium gilvum (strain PYR-GCK) TaxID=350054 RepID=A4TFW6_MYCGI
MTDNPLSLVEKHLYQELFLHELNWSAPDSPPISYTADDGQTYTATNISSYKGLRVWVCNDKPGSKIEAELDRLIAKTTTDRLVIFHNDVEQVWRWPARRTKDNSTSTRLTSHRHRNGRGNPSFAARLDVIRLPIDVMLDANTVLTKVREAFDVEARNESKRASKLMARMYSALETAYPASYDAAKRDHEISVILARLLFLMFGDDTEMWENEQGEPVPDAFLEFIHLQTPGDASTLGKQLTDLFDALDKPGGAAANGINAVLPYINGGLFREMITLPVLSKDFREAVLDACVVDWSTISPAIFGSMFQSVRDAQTRRELGEHYTSEENILKTLNPLFLDELRAEFDRARTMKDEKGVLTRLWKRLGDIRYMDPACGCGNFIIVAFRELRDLELRIMERLQELAGASQLAFDPTLALKVTLDHFYGIEIDEWPARIAETAMFLVDRQCDLKLKERFGEAPQRLPIQTQANITVGNALRLQWQELCPSSESVVVAGNPPYLGKKQRTAAQTEDMQLVWGSAYSGEADYVTAWFAKGADYFGAAVGRLAFVTTNSVAQGVVVAPVFGALLARGWRIFFAHRTFAWSSDAVGQAVVHCVIIGMSNGPKARLRLFEYTTLNSAPIELEVSAINSYLVDGPNVLVTDRRRALNAQLDSDIRFGSMAADNGGLFVDQTEYMQLAAADPVALNYLRPFIGARELLHSTPRWCIWIPDDDLPADVANSRFLQDRIEHVYRFRSELAKDAGVRAAAATPWRFNRVQQPSSAYLCIPRRVSESRKYYPAARFEPDVVAGDATFVVDDPDGFFFGVISSTMFITWQRTVGGRIKSDLRFASTFTWNTLPLPAVPTKRREAIAQAGKQVLAARALHSSRSLADQYDPEAMDPQLVAAHDQLDDVVDSAFGATGRCFNQLQRQEILFKRYAELSASQPTPKSTSRRRD